MTNGTVLRLLFLGLVALPAVGCSTIRDNYAQTGKFETPLTYTTASTRIIMERTNPVTGQQVVCTEPAPDSDVAFANSANGNANGGNGVISAGLGFGFSSNEAAAELAGRSTALLGLRDGLFRTCEAYANGVIGADAYALVLARYGQLMTTLFLGQDVTGAAGTGSSVTINATAQPATPSSTTPTATDSSKTTTPATKQNSAYEPGGTSARPGLIFAGATQPVAIFPAMAGNAAPLGAAEPRIMDALTLVSDPGAAAQNKPQANVVAAPANPAPAAAKPTPAAASSANTDTQTAPAAASSGATGALVLGRMNEDYFALDNNIVPLLVTACLNENDPTRIPAPSQLIRDARGNVEIVRATNSYMSSVCNDLNTVTKIETAALAASKLQPNVPPIDPTASASSAKQTTQKKTQATPDPAVKLAQAALARLNYYTGPIDGLLGPLTDEAIKDFQAQGGISPSGTLDSKTKAALGVGT